MNADRPFCPALGNYSWWLAILLWAVVSTSPDLFGQALTSLSGTVTDPTGAVVPGTTVILESIERGTKRETTSDESGRYWFAQVQPDTYQITARAPGFRDVLVSKVQLLVNTPATINIAFEKLGVVAEALTVTSQAAQVNTTDGSLGNAITAEAITQLPFYARDPIGLFFLQPGVTNFGGGIQGSEINGAVNGGKNDQANITLDGMDVNDQDQKQTYSVLRITPDSVQELRTTTSNANADQGRSSGGQIALVSKSGTNEIHGSLYDYHRGTETAANGFFDNMVGNPKAPLLIDVFGGSLGGPIKKNRLFFFANYEGRRDRSGASVLQTVPSAKLRQGIVQYLKTDGAIGELSPDYIKANIDPLHIGPNPAVLQLFQSYPSPNDNTQGDGMNTLGYRFSVPQRSKQDTYISRVDYVVDSAGKHTLFWRGNLQNDHAGGVPQFPGDIPSSVGLNNSKGISVGYNSILKPNLISTFRYGFTRFGAESTGIQPAGAVRFTGIDDRYALTTGDARTIPVHQVSEDLAWIHGAHNVRLGGVGRWIRNIDIRPAPFHSADIRANRLKGAAIELEANVPDLPADSGSYRDNMVAVLGLISDAIGNYRYDINGSVLPLGSLAKNINGNNEYEFYAQDSWKVTHALTVTGGFRWSLMPPFYEGTGAQTSTTFSLNDWFNQRMALAQQGLPQYTVDKITFVDQKDPRWRPLYPYHKKNFAPRLSLAYSPQANDGWLKSLTGGPGKTSIRAGWGMFYDLFGSTVAHQFIGNQPGFSTSLLNGVNTLTAATAPRFTGIYDIPSQLIPPPTKGGFPQVLPDTSAGYYLIDDTLKPPYTMNMNLSVGREFGHGFFVQGSYVGRLSHRSLLQRDVATPTNLKDPASGMDYFTAASQLMRLGFANTPTAQVPAIPFWENLFPGAAGNGLTATQAMYNEYKGWNGDATDALYDIDVYCYPACSKFGPFTMFNQQVPALSVPSTLGKGAYHAMQWTVRKRFGEGLTFDLNYTWSKSMDYSSRPEWTGAFGQEMVVNAFSPRQMRAVSTYDARHIFNAWWVWQLPVGKGKTFLNQSNRLVDTLLGGWQISGLWTQSSGLPVTAGNGRAWPTDYWVAGYATQIAPVPGGSDTHNGNGPNLFSDPAGAYAAYSRTLAGETGQRNGLRSDGAFGIDTALSKRFIMPYNEHHTVQVRWESFNMTNTARFGCVTPSRGNPAQFGKYSCTLNGPRVMQFALRYEF